MDNISYIFDYMLADEVCSTITVYDDGTVGVENFVDDVLLTAFGVKEDITVDDIEYLFSTRCFPKSRENCRQLLEDGGFGNIGYDVYAIVRKTEGRMSDDEFWIRFHDKSEG